MSDGTLNGTGLVWSKRCWSGGPAPSVQQRYPYYMYLIAQHTGGGCPGPECSFIFQLIKVDSVSCECCKACSTSSLDRFDDKLKYCGFRLRWLDVHTTRAAAAATNLRHECAHGRVTRSPSWSRRTHMASCCAGCRSGWRVDGLPAARPIVECIGAAAKQRPAALDSLAQRWRCGECHQRGLGKSTHMG